MPVLRTADISAGNSFPSMEQMFLWTVNGDFARMGRLVGFIPLVFFLLY
jgi:hypothetical protein